MYDYMKALHLIAIIAWMVGLLYLPRLYVYHSEVLKDSISYDIFLIMEKRLLKIIMLPSMILSLLFGLILLKYNWEIIFELYFQIKIFSLLVLFAFHGYLSRTFKSFEQKKNTKVPNFFRKINEIPTVFMIIIIIMVVVKPDLM